VDTRLPSVLIADLHSTDSRARVEAAHALRTRGAMPPEAVPALIQALQVEHGKLAKREELLALAVSGAPQAEPLICQAIYDTDVDVRGWGKKALTIWLPMNPRSRGCPPTH
jgi:HEAT repeat protein